MISLILIIFWYLTELFLEDDSYSKKIKKFLSKLVLFVTPILLLLIIFYWQSLVLYVPLFNSNTLKNTNQVEREIKKDNKTMDEFKNNIYSIL